MPDERDRGRVFGRRDFLGQAGAAAVAPRIVMPPFNIDRPHDLTPDAGGGLIDRPLEEAANPGLRIGSARFLYNQKIEHRW